jgi:Uma2 family endonuclease
MVDMIKAPAKTYTVEEFWDYVHLPENAGRRLELVNGEIVEMVPTGGEHGEVGGELFGLIWSHNRIHKLGRVTNAETGYVLTIREDNKAFVRAPDIGFISIKRAPAPFLSDFVPMPPDLAVEVVSPGDLAEEIEIKVQNYLQYGVRLVWLLYPALKKVFVRKLGQAIELSQGDILSGEDVLPGFEVKVSDIFPKS